MINLKKIISLLFTLLMSPFIFTFFILKVFNKAGAFFPAFSQILSLLPGKSGSFARIAFYRYSLTSCHSNCFIGFGTLFAQLDTEIHQGCYIGPQSNIGSCQIEKNCLLGSGVQILSGKRQHNFTNNQVPVKDQGGTYEKVTIGENTWIGNGAIIMAHVGKNCIIGAGSVVVHDVEDNCIMSGNPAKLIKVRS